MRRSLLSAFLALTASTQAVYAYVGPGVGAGTLAVVLGVLGSIVLWLFAVLWYPFKRMLRRRRVPAHHAADSENRPSR